jgi:hypothetical protein
LLPPIDLLIILLLITGIAVAIDRLSREKSRLVYRHLAKEHQMHYSSRDSLRLTPRVAAALPVPGAAAVRVIDLLYCTDESAHHYVFTAEYTLGAIGAKTRVRRAAVFSEPKANESPQLVIRLAPSNLPLIEQYRAILAQRSW